LARRIYTLAKELGVGSKTIVAKCQAEGLSDTVKNHMSTLSAGLEATIREWFSEVEAAHTAVEEADKVDVAAAKRKVSKKKKKRKPKAKEPEEPPAEAVAESGQSPAVEQEQIPTAQEPEIEAPLEETPIPEEQAAVKGASPPPKPNIVPSPKHVPAPAKLQGPKVIRVEAPERVEPIPTRSKPSRVPARKDLLTPSVESASPESPQQTKPRRRASDTGKKDDETKPKRRLIQRRGRLFDSGERLREWRNRDLLERSERLAQASGQLLRGRQTEIRTNVGPSTLPRSGKVVIKEPITVKDLSAAIGVKGSEIIGKLMNQGIMASLNATIQSDVAELLALEYGADLEIEAEVSLLETFVQKYEALEAVDIQSRSPVVTFLGHVDHGKTSLLDRIRSSQVVDGEAGGITQHIGAYRVHVGDNRDVIFLDTPGHEAFTAMRSRGANMTDIVVLVVAGDDGVMPQTEEAINHAKAAGVPVVVALNKIDLPGVDENRILGQLAEKGLSPHEWGGDTEVVRTSAMTGKGIDELLEHLSYIAELAELKADVGVPASGAVVEAELTPGRGVVARLLVQRGTLKVGDTIATGGAHGRIRALIDENGKHLDKVGPSMPIEVMGLDVVPEAGKKFYVTDGLPQAKLLAEEDARLTRDRNLSRRPQITLDNFMGQLDAYESQELCLILRADVQGSVDVLCKSLDELSVSEVKINILQAMVGGITEGDVLLAETSGAIIIGFNVVAGEQARKAADRLGVEIRPYRIIYEIIDDISKALENKLAPLIEEKILGHAQVRQIFKISRIGTIAGCYMNDGVIIRTSKARLIRDDVVINDGMSLESLKREKNDVREVKAGLECGIKLAGFDDVKIADIIELYEKMEIARTLSSVAAENTQQSPAD
jgi:translation initiation factor IF-2